MFRHTFRGGLLQLFPLNTDYIKELTGAGDIDCRKKKAIVFFEMATISIDGGIEVPVMAGSAWAISCETIHVTSAVKYGIV